MSFVDENSTKLFDKWVVVLDIGSFVALIKSVRPRWDSNPRPSD